MGSTKQVYIIAENGKEREENVIKEAKALTA